MSVRAIDVCVVGGGLAGLAVACAFRAAGRSVTVIERRTEPGDPNRGDFLRPRAAELLRAWGVPLAQHGALAVRELVVEGEHSTLARVALGDGAALPHRQLEQALRVRATAMGADVRRGWTLQTLQQGPSGRVCGVTAVTSSDGAEFRARLVVGADGRSSPVRTALALRHRTRPRLHELVACEAELAPGTVSSDDRVRVRLGSRGGGLLVPLGGRRVRVVAVCAPGEGDPISRLAPDRLGAELPRRTPLPPRAQIDPARVRFYELTETGNATNYASLGAVCIGDAVHAAPAPSGEGMQMALLDAEALARHVAPALGGDERALDRALAAFELERWPDNERRLARARAALRWLLPLGPGRERLLRAPLAKLAIRSLLAVE